MILRLARRTLLGAFTLLLATALLYAAIRLVPGTPWADDPSTPPERIAEWNARHHLDRPLPAGYLLWLGDVLRGDLGASYSVAAGERVAGLIVRSAPTSIALGIIGLGFALVVAVLAGLGSARRPGGAWDRAWSAGLHLLQAAPAFWVALVLQNVLSARLRLLPPLGAGPLDLPAGGPVARAASVAPFWILPPACLALGSLAFFFRFMRASFIETASSSHVRAARARGLPEHAVMGRHVFAGAAVHLATLAGILVPSVIGGSVVIEQIFALPGLGRLFFSAVAGRDYPVVMGVGLIIAIATIAGSLAGDLLALLLEPRLRSAHEAPT